MTCVTPKTLRALLPRLALCTAFGLAGCASGQRQTIGSATGPAWNHLRDSLQLEVDSALWRQAHDSPSLLSGAVRFDAPQRLFDYRARYALDRSAHPSILPGDEPGPATTLGQEYLGHGLGARLPLFFSSAPLQMDLEDRHQALMTPQGRLDTETRHASLSWAPAPLVFGLDWKDSPQVITHTLVCNMDGSVQVPLTALALSRPQQLSLSARRCTVAAPDRGVAELPLQAWGVAWSRQGGTHHSTLSLTQFEPERSDGLDGDPALPSAREIDLTHERLFGAYQTRSVLRLRQLQSTPAVPADTRWSAETRVSRHLQQLHLWASVMHAPDPLWFLPSDGRDSHRNQIGLGVGFKRWIVEALDNPAADMGLSLSWREPVLIAQPPEGSVNWNFSYKW